jgi:hypothetical protein
LGVPEGGLTSTWYETFVGSSTLISPDPALTLTSDGGRVNDSETSPEPSSAITFRPDSRVPVMSPEPAVRSSVPAARLTETFPDPLFSVSAALPTFDASTLPEPEEAFTSTPTGRATVSWAPQLPSQLQLGPSSTVPLEVVSQLTLGGRCCS